MHSALLKRQLTGGRGARSHAASNTSIIAPFKGQATLSQANLPCPCQRSVVLPLNLTTWHAVSAQHSRLQPGTPAVAHALLFGAVLRQSYLPELSCSAPGAGTIQVNTLNGLHGSPPFCAQYNLVRKQPQAGPGCAAACVLSTVCGACCPLAV